MAQGKAGQGKAEEIQALAVAEAGCHEGRRAALADIRNLVTGEFEKKKGGGLLVNCSFVSMAPAAEKIQSKDGSQPDRRWSRWAEQ